MDNNHPNNGNPLDAKWEKTGHGQKDDVLNNSHMNNLRADAALRAENMSDTELLNAYERNERAYQAEKRAKNAPKIEDKSPFIIKMLKKPLQWFVEQIKAVAEAIKAGMLRVALGTDGVNKVIENTRKDDEKAERKAMQDKEIEDLDKNAIREELNKRMHSNEKAEEVTKGTGSPESKHDEKTASTNTPGQDRPDEKGDNGPNSSPTQGTNEQKEKTAPEKTGPEPTLGKNDQNRLDRMYRGATGKDNESQYKEFKTSIETHFKDNYGLNIMLKAVEKDKGSQAGYLQFTINNKELGFPAIKYMGHGNIVIEGGDKNKTEQVKNLISHYINNYDKDSQKSRMASGIYPSQKEIASMLDEFKTQQGEDKIETNFYGVNITGVKDGDKGYVFQFGNSESKFECHPKDFSSVSVKDYFKNAIHKEIDGALDKAYENAKSQSLINKKTSKTKDAKINEQPTEDKRNSQGKEPTSPVPENSREENKTNEESLRETETEKGQPDATKDSQNTQLKKEKSFNDADKSEDSDKDAHKDEKHDSPFESVNNEYEDQGSPLFESMVNGNDSFSEKSNIDFVATDLEEGLKAKDDGLTNINADEMNLVPTEEDIELS